MRRRMHVAPLASPERPPLGTALDAAQRRPRAALPLLCLLLFLPGFFTLPATDRDEARFAQASRQMVESGDYVRIRFGEEERNKKRRTLPPLPPREGEAEPDTAELEPIAEAGDAGGDAEALHGGRGEVWVPGLLRPIFAGLRHAPRALWRRMPR